MVFSPSFSFSSFFIFSLYHTALETESPPRIQQTGQIPFQASVIHSGASTLPRRNSKDRPRPAFCQRKGIPNSRRTVHEKTGRRGAGIASSARIRASIGCPNEQADRVHRTPAAPAPGRAAFLVSSFRRRKDERVSFSYYSKRKNIQTLHPEIPGKATSSCHPEGPNFHNRKNRKKMQSHSSAPKIKSDHINMCRTKERRQQNGC